MLREREQQQRGYVRVTALGELEVFQVAESICDRFDLAKRIRFDVLSGTGRSFGLDLAHRRGLFLVGGTASPVVRGGGSAGLGDFLLGFGAGGSGGGGSSGSSSGGSRRIRSMMISLHNVLEKFLTLQAVIYKV